MVEQMAKRPNKSRVLFYYYQSGEPKRKRQGLNNIPKVS
jgi:hypothetical protein